jgi:hypothetical protein
MKELTVSRRYPLGARLHKRTCDERVRDGLEAARPLVAWLGEQVGPSRRLDSR